MVCSPQQMQQNRLHSSSITMSEKQEGDYGDVFRQRRRKIWPPKDKDLETRDKGMPISKGRANKEDYIEGLSFVVFKPK